MRCQLYAALLPWRGDEDSRGQAGDQHGLAHSAPSLPTGSLAPGTAHLAPVGAGSTRLPQRPAPRDGGAGRSQWQRNQQGTLRSYEALSARPRPERRLGASGASGSLRETAANLQPRSTCPSLIAWHLSTETLPTNLAKVSGRNRVTTPYSAQMGLRKPAAPEAGPPHLRGASRDTGGMNGRPGCHSHFSAQVSPPCTLLVTHLCAMR